MRCKTGKPAPFVELKVVDYKMNEVAKNGMNDQCGLIINASRSIIYASQETDFYKYSRTAAKKIQQQMEKILNKRGI